MSSSTYGVSDSMDRLSGGTIAVLVGVMAILKGSGGGMAGGSLLPELPDWNVC